MPPNTRRNKKITLTFNLNDMLNEQDESPSPVSRVKSKPPIVGAAKVKKIRVSRVKKMVPFMGKIDSLSDLIKLADEAKTYSNIDVAKLVAIKKELIELNNLIGLDAIKKSVFEQLVFYLQNMHEGSEMYLNTVIYGPPGTGKTTVAKLLGRIFSKLKVIKLPEDYEYEDEEEEEGIFEVARRDDLIGEYLGSTSIKTQEFLQMCIGGVVFIDEVYSLGNKDGGDSFAKEAIDAINLFLSEHRDHFMMVIAGYKDEINQCFFKYNEGLRRRFMWHHTIDPYSPEQLRDIFLSKLNQSQWTASTEVSDIMLKAIREYPHLFVDNAGSIENFITLLKIKHSKRVILLDEKHKKVILPEDIKASIQSAVPTQKNESFMSMYM